MESEQYPQRPPFFAQRFIRLLSRTCAAQTIGTDAAWLLAVIATTEDAARYKRPVTYYNGQLMPLLGFTRWHRLEAARKAAVDGGWLHFESPGNGRQRRPGIYWVTIPEHANGLHDSPVDEGFSSLSRDDLDYIASKSLADRYFGDDDSSTESVDESALKASTKARSKAPSMRAESVEPSILALCPSPSPIPEEKPSIKTADPSAGDIRGEDVTESTEPETCWCDITLAEAERRGWGPPPGCVLCCGELDGPYPDLRHVELPTAAAVKFSPTNPTHVHPGLGYSLDELIRWWNRLGPACVARQNKVRPIPIAAATVEVWRRITQTRKGGKRVKNFPALLDAFRDLDALGTAVRKAKFCHGQGWFTLTWLVEQNDQRTELKVCKLLAGAYDHAQNGHGRRGTEFDPNSPAELEF